MIDRAVEDQIRGVLTESLGIELPPGETDLIESGVIDSLTLVELLFALEHAFGVSLPLDELDIDSFRSVERIGAFVTSLNGQHV